MKGAEVFIGLAQAVLDISQFELRHMLPRLLPTLLQELTHEVETIAVRDFCLLVSEEDAPYSPLGSRSGIGPSHVV